MSGVRIKIRADSSQARSEIAKLENSVSRIGTVASRIGSALSAAFATYSSFVSTRAIVRISDQFLQLENRLKLVQQEGETVSGTFKALNRLSIQSRTPIQQTATTYSRLARSLAGTGRSQEEFLAVTEAINKATKLGNQPLATQQAALFQLSQAFSSGVLRGEEFNSVSEGAPEILNALTEALGVNRYELREMAFDGQITSDVLSNSLLKSLPRIREEFALMTPTVRETSQILRSEFERAINEIDKEIGISSGVAERLGFLTTVFTYIADNAQYHLGRVKVAFLEFRFQAAEVYYGFKDTFGQLFLEDFNVDDFIKGLTNSTQALKDFLGIGSKQDEQDSIFERFTSKIPTIDLSSPEFFSGLNTVMTSLEIFYNNVTSLFWRIYDDIVGYSSWGETFWEGVNSIGGPKFQAALQFVEKTLSSWGSRIRHLFKDIMYGSVESVDFLSGNLVETRSGGLYALWDAFSNSEIVQTAANNLDVFAHRATNAGISLKDGFISYLQQLNENFQNLGSRSREAMAAVDEFVLGEKKTEITPFGPEEIREGGALQSLANGFDSALNFIGENWGTALALYTAYRFLRDLDSELRDEIFKGALAGVGFAMVTGLVSFFTSPLGIGLAAIGFLLTFEDSIRTSNIPYSIGQSLVEGIKSFFDGSEGESAFQRILDTIVILVSGFGQGILDALGFPEAVSKATEPWSGAVAGALSLALISAGARGILKNGAVGLGTKIAGFAFGQTFSNSAQQNFRLGIATAIDNTNSYFGGNKNSRLSKAALGIGDGIGKTITGAMRGVLAAEGTELMTNFLFTKIGDGEVSKIEGQFSDVIGKAVGGATLGATVGGPLGALIVGLGAGIVGIWQSPELLAAIQTFITDLGDEISKAFQDAWDALTNYVETKISNITLAVEGAFTSAWDAVSTKISAFFSNLNPFSDDAEDAVDTVKKEKSSSGGRNRPRDNVNPNGLASGGLVTGPGGPKSDLIPAMLSNQEFVIQASAVKKFGVGFLSLINAGIAPRFFSEGTAQPDPEFLTLSYRLLEWQSKYDEYSAIKKSKEKLMQPYDAVALNAILAESRKQIKAIELGLGQFNPDGTRKSGFDPAAVTGGLGGGKGSDKETIGQTFAKNIAQDFKQGLVDALKTGDFKSFGKLLLDSFTMNVIDAFATGITDRLFQGLIGKDGQEGGLSKFFSGMFDFGKKLKVDTGEQIAKGIEESSGGIAGSNFFTKIKDSVGSLFGKEGIFGSLFESVKGLFGGGFNIFGSLFSLFSGNPLGMITMSQGGIVPRTSYSQTGIDSVPAMLTPGELVVPADKVNGFLKGNTGNNQTVVNLSITGDISRQTRTEIIKMLPTIATGVNAQNKEGNFKYR